MEMSGLSPFSVIVAEDPYQKRKLLESLRLKIKALSPSYEEQSVDLKQTTWADIFDGARTYSLLGGKRLIFVYAPKELTGEDDTLITPYLSHPSDFSFIYVFVPKVDQRKKLIKELAQKKALNILTRPTPRDLPMWISRIAQELGVTLAPGLIQTLANILTPDLALVELELAKLKLYCHPDTKISIESVNKLLLKVTDENVFEFLDQLFDARQGKALSLSRNLLEGDAVPLSLSSMMVRHVLLLAKCHSLPLNQQSPSEAARALGVPPFAVAKYLQQSKKISPAMVVKVLEILSRMDRQLKGSPLPPEQVFEASLRAISETIHHS